MKHEEITIRDPFHHSNRQFSGERTEARDDRARGVPQTGAGPHDARPPWAEHPLVGAGDEEVAAELVDAGVLVPEAVHAVDAEDHAVLRIAGRVDLADGLGHGGDRQLDTGARVHPRHREHPRAISDGPPGARRCRCLPRGSCPKSAPADR